MLIRPKLIPTEQLEKAIQDDMDSPDLDPLRTGRSEAQAAWRKENPGKSDPAIWAEAAKDSHAGRFDAKKTEQLERQEQKMEKASKEQRGKGLRAQTPDYKGDTPRETAIADEAGLTGREREIKGRRALRGGPSQGRNPKLSVEERENAYRSGKALRNASASLTDTQAQKMEKALQKQCLDNTAVQLEKIFGFRDRKKKEPELGDAGVTPSWSKKWRVADEDKKRVTRQRAQVKEGVGRAAGAVGGAAYEATGAAEKGAKRAGSAIARAFGAGRRKAQDVAGAPGRRQERKASERHKSNLSQQATLQRVAASDARRDARQQRPTSPEAGRTGYSNGHDTGLGGKVGERSAAIPRSRSASKVQQSDVNRGAAAAREQATSYQTPGARARAAAPVSVTPASGGTRPPKQGWGGGAAPGAAKPRANSTPKVESMQKAMISLQKYLDGDTFPYKKEPSD